MRLRNIGHFVKAHWQNEAYKNGIMSPISRYNAMTTDYFSVLIVAFYSDNTEIDRLLNPNVNYNLFHRKESSSRWLLAFLLTWFNFNPTMDK